MQIYFCGMTGSMIYNFGGSILRAAGDIRSPLLFLSIAGVLNVLLNVLFVVGFKMDVAGVALATALSQAVSAVLVLFTAVSYWNMWFDPMIFLTERKLSFVQKKPMSRQMHSAFISSIGRCLTRMESKLYAGSEKS